MSSRLLMTDPDEPKREPPPPAAPEKPEPLPGAAPPPAPEPLPTPEPPPAREAQPEPLPESTTAEGDPPRQELSPEIRKRLDSLTREKYEARRQADELQQRLAQIERDQERARTGGASDPVETAKEQLRAEATQMEFNRACNDLYRRGQQEYGSEMDDAVRALNAVGFGNRNDALQAIAQLPDGHRVYRSLASDLDNAARVLSLPPMAMAVELARMAIGQAPADADSGTGRAVPLQGAVPLTHAPEPLRAVGGTSRAGPVPLEKTSMADFIRRRDQEERRSRISR